MPEEEKVKRGSVGRGKRSEVKVSLQLAPGLRLQASAFPPLSLWPRERAQTRSAVM